MPRDFNDGDEFQTQPPFRTLEAIAEHESLVNGVEFGLSTLDKLTGGLRPRRLNIVAGYSHHGKTSLMLRGIKHNVIDNEFPCLFISGDDTDDMILHKIIAAVEHISTEQVEANGPKWRRDFISKYNLQDLLMIAATKDDYTLDEIERLIVSASKFFGESPVIVCFDYISLLKIAQGDSDAFNIRKKYQLFKRQLVRRYEETIFMVGHQCNKSAANCGALTLNHMEYGGHQDADGVVIGCRRNALEDLEGDALRVEMAMPRTYLSVMKNKVTGRKSSTPIGTPYLIDPISGEVREILQSDYPSSLEGVQPYETNGQIPTVKYGALSNASTNGH